MATWPEDHPGRNCSRCGKCVYPIWVGDTPPPGECTNPDTGGGVCDDQMHSLALGLWISRTNKQPLHPDHVALMERTGVTMEEVEAFLARKEAIDALGAAVQYGERKDLGNALVAFLTDEDVSPLDTPDRALVLLDEIVSHVEFANGERTMMDIWRLNAEWKARALQILGDIDGRDYEDAEGE